MFALAQTRGLENSAIAALGSIGTKESLRYLQMLLKSQSAFVRTAAAFDLAANGKNEGVSQLWRALRNNDIVMPSYNVSRIRGRVALALVELGAITTRAQLDEIFKYTESEGRFLCPVLARTKRPVFLRKLRALLVDMSVYHGVRKWAALALGDIRDGAAASYLTRALGDPVSNVRAAAEAALLQIEGAGVSGVRKRRPELAPSGRPAAR